MVVKSTQRRYIPVTRIRIKKYIVFTKKLSFQQPVTIVFKNKSYRLEKKLNAWNKMQI